MPWWHLLLAVILPFVTCGGVMLAIKLYERRSENKFTPHPTTDQVSGLHQHQRETPGAFVHYGYAFSNPCGEVQLPASGVVGSYPPLPDEPILTRFDLMDEDLV